MAAAQWRFGFELARSLVLGGCCLDVEAEALRQGYLFSWVANQISAAVRLVPLGPRKVSACSWRWLR